MKRIHRTKWQVEVMDREPSISNHSDNQIPYIHTESTLFIVHLEKALEPVEFIGCRRTVEYSAQILGR